MGLRRHTTTTMLCGMYCVLSVVCLLSSISTAVADNNTPKRELNCTAVLIEAEAKRQSGVSELFFYCISFLSLVWLNLC